MIIQSCLSTLLICMFSVTVPEPVKVVQVPQDPDPAYTQVITQRAQNIVDTLGIEDASVASQVRDLIADQYRSLSAIHDTHDAQIEAAKKLDNASAVKSVEDMTKHLLDQLHVRYLIKLSKLLTPDQIDKVKDGMTYNIVHVTYNAYLQLNPDLTEEQKATIMAYLIEARETAMDAGSSKEKHGWFGKYKGRINNYLSEQRKQRQNASAASASPAASLDDASLQPRYPIAVCDWMILKRQKLGAFERTHQIGAQGVELDMGSLGQRDTFESKLSDPVIRQQFLDEARKYDLRICSIAMSGFYAQSFAERPTVPQMLTDCIETMKNMNVKIAFLPLGVTSDPAKHPELRGKLVDRLRLAGKMAEQAGVIIGIETELDAAEQIKLLDEVGSDSIRIYYNFSNALENGRDLYKELELLGKDRICQIHCTDRDGVWLQDNQRLDMNKVKETLDKIGWSGWLVIERSRNAENPRDVLWNFSANTKYLESVFQK